MWFILLFLLAGTGIGIIMRKVRGFSTATDKISTWLIYILLFIMGLLVGSDDRLMNHIGALGAQALLIAFFAILGSIFLSRITFRYFFRNEK